MKGQTYRTSILFFYSCFCWTRHYMDNRSLTVFLVVFSDLKNNKNSRSYGCSNKAKTRVFCTFRLGLLKNVTWWSNSVSTPKITSDKWSSAIPEQNHADLCNFCMQFYNFLLGSWPLFWKIMSSNKKSEIPLVSKEFMKSRFSNLNFFCSLRTILVLCRKNRLNICCH